MHANEAKKIVYLNTNAKIILHTKIVQSLFNHKWEYGKLGLLQFAKVVTNLWEASKQDDPYADWYLMKTYQSLYDGREKITKMETQLTAQLATLRGVTVDLCSSTEPHVYDLRFSTPFAYMGAYLLADMDYVCRQLLTLSRMGLLIMQDEISLSQIKKIAQDTFVMPMKWRSSGVTRKDVLENNQNAHLAKELLGDLPDTILYKKIEFSFLPKKNEKINASVGSH